MKGKDDTKLKSIAGLDDVHRKELIIKLIDSVIKENDKNLGLEEIIKKYADDICELCTIDKDLSDVYGFVNDWWVFNRVAKELDYDIFMADVSQIGYKRTIRNIKLRKNELYRTATDGTILVDDGVHETVLDYIRDIKWD